MKIDRKQLDGVAGPRWPEAVRQASPAERAGGAQAIPSTDHLVLSSQSLQVNELQQLLASQPAVRAELIQELKQRIARGEYQVDPHDLAGRLLRSRVIDG